MRLISATALLQAGIIVLMPSLSIAQDDAKTAEAVNAEFAGKPFGQFVTIGDQVDDELISELTNLTRELQAKAVREKRRAVLVLELSAGSSRQGQIHDLAKVLV